MKKKKSSSKPKKPKDKDDGKDLDEIMGALLKVPPKRTKGSPDKESEK